MSAREPLPISVVIPAFNAEQLLGRAIASVHAQTQSAAELIVVDDGSTDGTAELARSAGARVIEQENGGCGAARNAGVRAARYPWIAFLDADDAWQPAKLAVQWPATRLRPQARLICTDFEYVAAVGGAVLANHMAAQPSYHGIRRLPLGQNASLIERGEAARAIVRANFIGFSTVLVAADLILEGEFFLGRSELRSGALCEEAEDAEWLLRILRHSDLIAVEQSLGTYFAQTGSLSASAGRMRYGDVKLLDRLAAEPARYAAGIEAEIAPVRRRKLREATVGFLRSGQPHHARVVASEAFAECRSPAWGALLAVLAIVDTGAGRAALEGLRSVWKLRKVLLGRRKAASP